MLADTTFIIDLMRKNKEAQEMLAEIDLSSVQLNISSVVLFELCVGVQLSKQPEKELALINEATASLTKLGITERIARRGGFIAGELIRKGERIGDNDCLIAATALETNDTLLTRNSKDFSKIQGLKIETY